MRFYRNSMLRIGLALLLFGLVLLFILSLSCDKGLLPVGYEKSKNGLPDTSDMNLPPDLDTIVWMGGQMHLRTEPSLLLAAYGDTAAVTVMAYDNYHNPVVNKKVVFWANVGLIRPASVLTDSNGLARATFVSVPLNTEALVIANLELSEDSIIQRSQNITLSGLEVHVLPQAMNVLVDNVVPVRIEVVDAAGRPLANDSVVLRGGVTGTLVTLGNGTASTTITRNAPGAVSIVAVSSKGAVDSAQVNFWTSIPDTMVDQQNQIRQMRIYSSRSQLNADNTDEAVVTVILINENNNPAQGDTVRFSSDLGVIGAYAVVDSSGRASVILQSAPINGVCTIRAVSATTKDTVSTQILFGGISLHLTSDPSSLKIGSYTIIEALLRSASNTPIGGDIVTFTVSGGGRFEGGATLTRVGLNPQGKAQIRLTAASACSAYVHATTLNTGDSTLVVFTNNALTLTKAKNSLFVGGLDSTLITAKYVDGSDRPVAGIPVLFVTNAGVIHAPRDTTDSAGLASAYLLSADFAGTATVEARTADASVSTTVAFTAGAPAKIKVTVTPDNIKVNGGVATLIATVTDANGNRVSGADVNFRLLNGPGAGEYIVKPLVTAKDGEARTQLYSGSAPSMLLGAKVAAYVGNVADTTKLTLSGEPYAVSVARPQTDTLYVDNAGQIDSAVFDYFAGAVVKDINGNPVADGTEVHFSAMICAMAVRIKTFDHWDGVEGNVNLVKPVYVFRNLRVPFEDINNNFKMDEGVDLKLDFNDAVASRGDDVNGDGVCDYNPDIWDFWWDFNGNGRCDPGVGEPVYVTESGDSVKSVYADLNGNGVWDRSELLVDHNGNGTGDLPPSGDFRFALWEGAYNIFDKNFRFEDNNFGVVIGTSAVTVGGVAYTRLTYPRQYAHRFYVLVDAECQGVRDVHREPFLLIVIIKQ